MEDLFIIQKYLVKVKPFQSMKRIIHVANYLKHLKRFFQYVHSK